MNYKLALTGLAALAATAARQSRATNVGFKRDQAGQDGDPRSP